MTAAQQGGYVVAVSLRVKADCVEQFRQAILRNAAESLRTEDGCWVFDVAEDDLGTLFYLYEVYRDQAAFSEHLKTPHFLAFDQRTRAWVEDKQLSTYQRLLGD